MAITKVACSECKFTYSDQAEKCPKCKHPRSGSKKEDEPDKKEKKK